MATGRARLRPTAQRLTNDGAQQDSRESRTPIGHHMQLFPELPQHGTEYEKRKVHTFRGSSNNTKGTIAVLTFHPKYTLYHCFYLAQTIPNKPGFPYSACPLPSAR